MNNISEIEIQGELVHGCFQATLRDGEQSVRAEVRFVSGTEDRASRGDKAFVLLRHRLPVLGGMVVRNVTIREILSGPHAGELRVLWPQFRTGRTKKIRNDETGEVTTRNEYLDSVGPLEDRQHTNGVVLALYNAAIEAVDTQRRNRSSVRPAQQEKLAELKRELEARDTNEQD